MEWIKVEDRLPNSEEQNSIFVLVYDIYHGVVVRPYNQAHDCWDDEDADDYYCDSVGGKITHWMELPKAPLK